MKKRILSLSLALIMSLGLMTAAFATDEFSDVKPNDWYYNDVMECAGLGIATGANGLFRPNDSVTGVEFIAMLTRTFYADELAEIETPDGQPWYYPNITVAENLKISDSTLTFTDANINRYDMARALYNILVKEDKILSGMDSRITAAQQSIKDYSNIPSNRRAAVQQCYALGILTGMTDGTFSGESYMTRAQASTVIMRMLRLINEYVPDIADSSQPADSTPHPAEQTTEENTEAIPGQTLANGEAITDENIEAIIEQLKAKWPEGTDYYTNFCISSYVGDVKTLLWQWKSNDKKSYTSVTQGCGGFARGVSDGVYGSEGFPAHRVTSVSEMHPGDIIVSFTDQTHTVLTHVGVVTKVWKDTSGTWVYTAADNSSQKGVIWSTLDQNAIGKCAEVYSRFPV